MLLILTEFMNIYVDTTYNKNHWHYLPFELLNTSTSSYIHHNLDFCKSHDIEFEQLEQTLMLSL